MARKKQELSVKERIAILESEIARRTARKSKVNDTDGKKMGSVKLRYKFLADGIISFYLDIYKDGKRKYHFLKIYLDPAKVTNANDIGSDNDNAILEAEKHRKVFADEMMTGNDPTKKAAFKGQITLSNWMEQFKELKEKKGKSTEYLRQIDKTMKHLVKYKGSAIAMKEIDEAFCEGFIIYLANAKTSNGKPLSDFTQLAYYKTFVMALRRAVNQGIIAENPNAKLESEDKPHQPESDRAYLDISDVKKLIETPCKIAAVKRAYLFSCFCGLRRSDIIALKWGNIVNRDGQEFIEIKMVKTKKSLSVPLSDDAMKYMPDRAAAKDEDYIFTLPSGNHMNKILLDWAKSAGIKKHVTFHTARHTFATMELTAGADIYTTSKLLGHTDVKVTEIYAKVINEKKIKAVNLVGSLFNNEAPTAKAKK